jgi:spermidine synthase
MCRRALRRPGVACFNLFGSRFDPSFNAICTAFDDRVLALPAVDEGNRIVFALTGPRIDEPMTTVARRAGALEVAWRLPFRQWLADLMQSNDLEDRLRV